MSSEIITLIDLPSKPPCKCWSLNPWKTRFVLNYKGLNYRTEWTEYPDLKSKLQSCLPPHSEGKFGYTSPTIKLPDGTWVSDSRKIAAVLEERYPEPSLHLDAPQLRRVEELMNDVVGITRGVFAPVVPNVLLNEVSAEYWFRTREASLGMSMEQLQKQSGGPQAWKNVAPFLKEVTALLNETAAEGPFFRGNQVSYVDFVWAGYLIFIGRIGEEHLETLLETSGDREAHLRLLDAVKPWAERDGH